MKSSFKLKNKILKILNNKSSQSSGMIYWISFWELVEKLYPLLENINKDFKYSKGNEICDGGFTDNSPNAENRLIHNEHDVKNCIDDLEKENFLYQSFEDNNHGIILNLNGKEFHHDGGYDEKYFIQKFIEKHRAEIIAILAIIISIVLGLL